MEWIKCEDRMPELELPILASDGKYIHMAIHTSGFNDEIIHYACDYSCSIETSMYWMPLPKLPFKE